MYFHSKFDLEFMADVFLALASELAVSVANATRIDFARINCTRNSFLEKQFDVRLAALFRASPWAQHRAMGKSPMILTLWESDGIKCLGVTWTGPIEWRLPYKSLMSHYAMGFGQENLRQAVVLGFSPCFVLSHERTKPCLIWVNSRAADCSGVHISGQRGLCAPSQFGLRRDCPVSIVCYSER